jgi:adenylate cyclase
MATEATKLACEQHGGDRVVFRFLDRIVVKGRTQTVSVYEIVGLKETISEMMAECIQNFDVGMRAYMARDWTAAIEAFSRSAECEWNRPGSGSPADMRAHPNPSRVMIARCEYLQQHPPAADWSGVYVMRDK